MNKSLNKRYIQKRGFVALVGIVLLTSIMLGLVIYSSTEKIIFNDILTKKIYRTMNYYFAYNCVDQAKLKIKIDYFLIINNTISIPELNCSIVSVNKINSTFKIITKGDYMNATVYREEDYNF